MEVPLHLLLVRLIDPDRPERYWPDGSRKYYYGYMVGFVYEGHNTKVIVRTLEDKPHLSKVNFTSVEPTSMIDKQEEQSAQSSRKS